MQVFLPFRDFKKSVACLDNSRLNKQLLECAQMMRALARGVGDKTYPSRHPVTRAFRGHEVTMYTYVDVLVGEMGRRGIKWRDNYLGFVDAFVNANFSFITPEPIWLVDFELFERMSLSHRASLYHKNPEHYAQFESDAAEMAGRTDVVCCNTHAPYFYPVHAGYEVLDTTPAPVVS